MNKITLHGGPYDGKVIDLNHVCNNDDQFCPEHGYKFRHASVKEIEQVIGPIQQHEYHVPSGTYKRRTR